MMAAARRAENVGIGETPWSDNSSARSGKKMKDEKTAWPPHPSVYCLPPTAYSSFRIRVRVPRTRRRHPLRQRRSRHQVQIPIAHRLLNRIRRRIHRDLQLLIPKPRLVRLDL